MSGREEDAGWDPTRPSFGPEREESAARRPEASESGGAGEPSDAEASPEDDAQPLVAQLEGLAAVASRSAVALDDGLPRYARWAVETLEGGGKLLFCGNGGSAATVEHVAAEYVVRFRRRRRSLPAVALTTSSAVTTAAANDLGFEEVFARQVEGLADPDDLLVVHSTSGESENVLRAVRTATEMGLRSVGLLARGGGRAVTLVRLPLVVPTDDPARAQELHLAIEHAVVDRVDAHFAEEGG